MQPAVVGSLACLEAEYAIIERQCRISRTPREQQVSRLFLIKDLARRSYTQQSRVSLRPAAGTRFPTKRLSP